MIDIHSHIVPGIDDGADTIETSLRMLKIAEDDGIKTIFATPHYYRGRFETDQNEVKGLIDELNIRAREQNINIEILQGHEVYLDREILNLYREDKIKTLNNSRYLLIELPFDRLPDYALDMIYELRLLGVVPVIAHPERYMYFIKKPWEINKFIDEGCLFQLNGGSITGLFGKEIQKTSETFLKHGIISFIGSDAHTTNKRRPELKKFFDIIEKNYGELKRTLLNNVEKVINNEEILCTSEKIKDKRSIFDIFRR